MKTPQIIKGTIVEGPGGRFKVVKAFSDDTFVCKHLTSGNILGLHARQLKVVETNTPRQLKVVETNTPRRVGNDIVEGVIRDTADLVINTVIDDVVTEMTNGIPVGIVNSDNISVIEETEVETEQLTDEAADQVAADL